MEVKERKEPSQRPRRTDRQRGRDRHREREIPKAALAQSQIQIHTTDRKDDVTHTLSNVHIDTHTEMTDKKKYLMVECLCA